MLDLNFTSRELEFSFNAKASRGFIKKHKVWYLQIHDPKNPEVVGIGEAAPLEGLSPDFQVNMHEVLLELKEVLAKHEADKAYEFAKPWPSVLFALETALLDLKHGGTRNLWDTGFRLGKFGLSINGLVWMDTPDAMLKSAIHKVNEGFKIIKFKVGALDFEQEWAMLRTFRDIFPDVEIRLDANGAFEPEFALEKLRRLSVIGIHSIEQPIAPRQWAYMAPLIKNSPIPIALDEELIGVVSEKEKAHLIESLLPDYLILKPTLVGGAYRSMEWIHFCKKQGTGWWLTSALESNVGLNAIAQFASCFNYRIPHGLGTGKLYTNNVDCPLYIEKGALHYDITKTWGSIMF